MKDEAKKPIKITGGGRRMSAVILSQGKKATKIVGDKEQTAIPFVGTDSKSEWAQMGVGVILPDRKSLSHWGLALPRLLIQSWRAMKILEEIPEIHNDTLSACWYAAKKDPHSSEKNYLPKLENLLGRMGTVRLAFLRRKVLGSVPDEEELEKMLALIEEKKIEIATWELEEEINQGRLKESPRIKALIAKEK